MYLNIHSTNHRIFGMTRTNITTIININSDLINVDNKNITRKDLTAKNQIR